MDRDSRSIVLDYAAQLAHSDKLDRLHREFLWRRFYNFYTRPLPAFRHLEGVLGCHQDAALFQWFWRIDDCHFEIRQ